MLGSSGLILRLVLFRPVLTWCAGTPKDQTCSHTICSGTIPLLSLLLAPFTQCSTALDQSATASLAASLGNIDWLLDFLRCSSHTLSLPYPPLSSVPCACRLSSLDFSSTLSLYFSHSSSHCCLYSSVSPASLSLSPSFFLPLPRSQLLLWTTENLI